MTFAAPLFLFAVAAGVIPVALHLIHTKKAVEVRFSTLRFLRLSVERTRRRKYLDDVSLLLVRIAALALIAVGLAKPAISGLHALRGHGASTAVVLVLDNSGSMALLDAGQPRFETARRAAEQILDALHEGDAVALILTSGAPAPEQGRLFHTQETVRQALGQCRVSPEKADLAAKLQQARTLLAEADALNKEIYVITDNQALSWQGLKEESEAEPDAGVPVVLVNVSRDPAPNVVLRHLHVEAPALTAGVPILVSVEALNTSPVPQQKHLELHINGSKESVSPTLNLPPGSAVKHEFRFSVDRGGVHRGEVRVAEEDGLALDNRLFFGLSVDQQIPVAVVKPRRAEIDYIDDAFYLERALTPAGADNWAVRVTTLTPDQVASESLTRYAVVFCVNLPAPEQATAERLRDYARAGGHLFWVCGSEVRPDAYNRMNDTLGGEVLPAPLAELRAPSGDKKESWHVGFLDRDHPALTPLTEPASLYQTVLIHKHFPLTVPPESQSRVLAKLDDSVPLLAERTVGSGSVLLLGTGLHVEWTNLPLKPIFLPLLARLTFHLAGMQADRSGVLVGAPLVVPLGNQETPADMDIVRPSGEVLRVRPEDAGAHSIRYADTHEVGIYLVRVGEAQEQKQYVFAVNCDPEESDSAELTSEEVKARFGQRPLLICDKPEEVAGTIHRLREGKSLWEAFLWAVLAGLVVEAFLANRFGIKPSGPGTIPQAGQEHRAKRE
jgi:hypothetical protein